MRVPSPFAVVVKALGAVACIVLLAYLAACGGEGSDDAVMAGQTNTVTFPAP